MKLKCYSMIKSLDRIRTLHLSWNISVNCKSKRQIGENKRWGNGVKIGDTEKGEWCGRKEHSLRIPYYGFTPAELLPVFGTHYVFHFLESFHLRSAHSTLSQVMVRIVSRCSQLFSISSSTNLVPRDWPCDQS